MSLEKPKVFWTTRIGEPVSDRIYFTLIGDEAFERWFKGPERIASMIKDIEAADFDAIKKRLLEALKVIQELPTPIPID